MGLKIVSVLFLASGVFVNISLCSEMSVNIKALEAQKQEIQELEKDIDIIIDKDAIVAPDLSGLSLRSQSYIPGVYWEDLFLAGLIGATLGAGFSRFVHLKGARDVQFFILLGATVALLGRRVAVKLFEQFGEHGDGEQVLRVPQELVEELVKNNSIELQRVGDL